MDVGDGLLRVRDHGGAVVPTTGKLPKSPGNANLRRGGGRTGPNKLTSSAKEAFALAFQGIGGADALTEWARGEPGEFFKLYARLIPTEVAADVKGALEIRIVRE